jgi:Ser/Thr protein kinase RdoA (MazF antagonist)
MGPPSVDRRPRSLLRSTSPWAWHPGSVRPFSELTVRGQRGRLRVLAVDALRRYSTRIEPTRVQFVVESFNTVFRVTSADGRRHALRVGAGRRIHPEGTEVAEVTWMAALDDAHACRVPAVVVADDGSVVIRHGCAGVPGERTCMVFDWIAGRAVADQMDGILARRLGRLSALLHEQAASHPLSAPPPVLVADRVLYWLVEDRLHELAPDYGSLFVEARERAQDTVDSLWRHPPHTPHLIHGDLTPSNVIVSRGDVVPIDFQDLAWGFDVQDVAITLSALHRLAQPSTLVEAFAHGYREVRGGYDFDPAVLASLVAGRRLHQLNLSLSLGRPGLTDVIARTGHVIRQWMASPGPPA